MKFWSIYRLSDGMFTGQQFGSSIPGHHVLNVPSGCGVMEGRHDHLCKRVEVTGDAWGDGIDGLSQRRVVDWRPPQPSSDHEWNQISQRWQLTSDASERAERRARALMRIAEVESRQPRAMREHALGYDGAAQRLRDLDAEIVSLRLELNAETDTTEPATPES